MFISTRGYDFGGTVYQASLEKKNKDIEGATLQISTNEKEHIYPIIQFYSLCLNNEPLYDIPEQLWRPTCAFLLSTVHSEWVEYFNKISLPNRNIPYSLFNEGENLQVFVSLIHLASVISDVSDLNKPDETSIIQSTYYGKVLYDNLPPQNRLIIYSRKLQKELIANPYEVEELMKIGHLFECSFKNTTVRESIFYRPYNIPILTNAAKTRLSDKAKSLMGEINAFYKGILSK